MTTSAATVAVTKAPRKEVSRLDRGRPRSPPPRLPRWARASLASPTPLFAFGNPPPIYPIFFAAPLRNFRFAILFRPDVLCGKRTSYPPPTRRFPRHGEES